VLISNCRAQNMNRDLETDCQRGQAFKASRLRGCGSQLAGTALRGDETAAFVWLSGSILSPLAIVVTEKSGEQLDPFPKRNDCGCPTSCGFFETWDVRNPRKLDSRTSGLRGHLGNHHRENVSTTPITQSRLENRALRPQASLEGNSREKGPKTGRSPAIFGR
jgi:hypothetical protein